MKKARLKININLQTYNISLQKGDILKRLSDNYIVDEGNISSLGRYITIKDVESNPDIFEIFEEKSAEKLANDLEFQVGDKVWDKQYKTYLGQIQYFDWNENMGGKLLSCKTEKRYYTLELLTNKVAIHCPTKEDFEFICNKENIDRMNINKEDICICINSKLWFTKDIIKSQYLILSVDEYCKAMDIKPLFITKDNVNVYNPEQICYGIYGKKDEKYYSAFPANCLTKMSTIFSTKQAAQQYLDSLTKYKGYIYECNDCIVGICIKSENVKCNNQQWFANELLKTIDKVNVDKILFYTEDFKDGSFPVKNCSNCNYSFGKGGCIGNNCKNNNYTCWQGELKGNPIYKGDKCWIINNTIVNEYKMSFNSILYYEQYDNVFENNLDKTIKAFSNEQNARNYYNKLLEKNKSNFEVGKWYKDIENNFYILYGIKGKHDGYVGFAPNWSENVANDEDLIRGKYELANMDEVKELLLNEAKRRYPVGTKFFPNHVNNNTNLYCIVINNNFEFIDNSIYTLLDNKDRWEYNYGNYKFGNSSLNRIVYYKGEWAKIINKADIINCDNNSISKKNIVEVKIPEGKEVVNIFRRYSNEIVIQHKENSFTKSCQNCLFKIHSFGEPCETSSMNSICNKYQSKDDLSNTKIFIGDNSKLRLLVQKKASELGWQCDFKTAVGLYFHNNTVSYVSEIMSFNKFHQDYIRIIPNDLGIKDEEYK